MTDYTPTTEEVRNKYSWWTDRNLVARGIPPTDTKAEFDRWLAEVKKDAYDEGWLDRTLLEDNPKHRQGETK